MPQDPVERIDQAEAAPHGMTFRNEAQLRLMPFEALTQSLKPASDAVPIRQDRRMPLIDGALKPVRNQLDDGTYSTLTAALALIFGTESMIVFKDVLRVGPDEAQRVNRWAMSALVRAALDRPSRSAVSRPATRASLHPVSWPEGSGSRGSAFPCWRS